MDKTEKLLAKLPAAQRDIILHVLLKLARGEQAGLAIKPLKGHKGLFRARVGNYRVIFRHDDKFELVLVTKRDDQTYRDLK